MNALSPTAQKVITAGLTATNPSSIAAATGLAIVVVYSGIRALEKAHLAEFDKEQKLLTLNEEGIALAKSFSTEVVNEPAAEIVITGAGTTDSLPIEQVMGRVDRTEEVKAEDKPEAGDTATVAPITFVVENNTKKAKAWAIIDDMQAKHADGIPGNRRKDIVKVLAATLLIKDNAASQYIHNHRKAHGLSAPKAKVDPIAVAEQVFDGVVEAKANEQVADAGFTPVDETEENRFNDPTDE